MTLKIRLLLFWLCSVLFCMLVVRLFFAVALDRHCHDNAHLAIRWGIDVLKTNLEETGAELTKAGHQIASYPSTQASVNMIDSYQDIDQYQPIIFDEEKKKISMMLSREVVQPGTCDLAVIIDNQNNLISFAQAGPEGVRTAYQSYLDGKPAIYGSTGNEHVQQDDMPAFVDCSSFATQSAGVYYHSCPCGFGVVGKAPIVRNFPKGSSREIGRLIMVKFLDQEFVSRLANLTKLELKIVSGDQSVGDGLSEFNTTHLPSGLPSVFSTRDILEESKIESDRYYLHALSLPAANGESAFVVFGIDRFEQKRHIAVLQSVLFWILAAIALFMLPAGYFFLNRMISTPVSRLIDGIRRFEDGDMEPIREFPASGEFSTLALTLNSMSKKLHEREKDLKQQRALLHSLVNSIPDLIFYKDQNSVYMGCNKAFEAFVGQKESEITGKTDLDLFPGKVARFFREKDQQVFESGEANRNEEWVTYPDGHQELLDTFKTPFVDPDKDLLGLVGVSRDITRLKETEQDLAREKERLAVTLRSIGDGVITSDIEGNVVLLNKVAEQLTGWSQEEASGKPVSKVFHIINEKTGVLCENPVEKVLTLGKIIGLANHTALISRDGVQRSIADSGAPIRDQESKIIGVVLVFRDVTDQLKMEEELLKIKKLESVGVLAGGIAHDFNNILTIILGNINLASRFIKPDNEAASLLRTAEKATLRAEKLTKQLLTFSKGGDPVRATAAISQIIRESAEFILHGSNVVCHYTIPDDLWLVDIDSGQISQVLQNLIVNACHAMPEGGKIDISCANITNITSETMLSLHRGDYLKIMIRDYGVGIPEKILDKIFDPFFSTKQEGSGLGLATCHSIINKHDGHIMVQSEPGMGTMFTIYLPAADRGKSAVKDDRTSLFTSGSGRIMVMDDEPMVRDLAEQMLTHLGYEVVLVVDGAEAIARYKEAREAGDSFDLIVMDLTIPGGMGGAEAVQEILAINPEAKVIVSSGYSNDPAMANYRDYGFSGAVAKPFDLTELNKAVRSVLS